MKPSTFYATLLCLLMPLLAHAHSLSQVCVDIQISISATSLTFLSANLNLDICICVTSSGTYVSSPNVMNRLQSHGIKKQQNQQSCVNQVQNNNNALWNAWNKCSDCVYPNRNAYSVCSSSSCAFQCNGQCKCPDGYAKTTNPDGTFTCTKTQYSKRAEVRHLHARSLGACKAQETVCAIPTNSRRATWGRREGFECVDTTSNIESCGGCAFQLAGSLTSAGQDCTIIPNVNEVSCINSTCAINSCQRGYTRSSDGKSCIKLASSYASPFMVDQMPAIAMMSS